MSKLRADYLSEQEREELKIIEAGVILGHSSNSSSHFTTYSPYYDLRPSPVEGCYQILILFLGLYPSWINQKKENLTDERLKFNKVTNCFGHQTIN